MPRAETKNQNGHHPGKELNILVQSLTLWILLLAAMALLWLILFLVFEIVLTLSVSWAGSFAAAFVSAGTVVIFAAILFRIRFR